MLVCSIPLFYANDEKDALFLSLKKDGGLSLDPHDPTLDLRVAQPTTGKVINLLDCETCFKHFYSQKMYTAKKDIHAFKAAMVLWLKSTSIQDRVE